MTYVNVSIPKIKTGAGAPRPKKPNVKFYRASDAEQFPTVNGVVSTADFTLKEGNKGVAVYLTPRSISRNDKSDGDTQDEMGGWIHNVAGNRPGDDEFFCAWLQENLNEGFIAITDECGDGLGRRLHGTPCNPLYMSVEGQDNNEGIMSALTFASGTRQQAKSVHYRGVDPPVHDNPNLDAGSGPASGSGSGGV